MILGNLISDRYYITRLIGSSAFISIYQAHDSALNRSIVIKVLDDISEEAKNQFREAVRTATLLDSPTQARVFDFGELDDGRFFSVMDFVEGVTYFEEPAKPNIGASESGQRDRVTSVAIHVLKLMPLTAFEREVLTGDLLEEYSEIKSKSEANRWLLKQVFKSALPIIYKTLKSRLASYFGERIR